MTPDICIEVRFRAIEEGGRKTPVIGEFYACPLFIDGEGFDCRLLIKDMELVLGTSYEVPVKFLSRDLVMPKLTLRKAITLWEDKDVADGKVTKIF